MTPGDLPPRPQDLTEQQWRIARRLADGEPAGAVADEEGVRLVTVLEWRYHPAFVLWLKLAKEARVTYAHTRAVGLADRALDTLKELLAADSDKVRLDAAKEILRLAGVGPDYVQEVDMVRRKENAALALKYVHDLLAGDHASQQAVAKLMEGS